jgi:hypothetical protein
MRKGFLIVYEEMLHSEFPYIQYEGNSIFFLSAQHKKKFWSSLFTLDKSKKPSHATVPLKAMQESPGDMLLVRTGYGPDLVSP